MPEKMSSEEYREDSSNLRPQWGILVPTVLVVLLICVPALLAPKSTEEFFAKIYNPLALNFGTLYLWLTAAICVICFYYALSRWGNIKFGRKDEKPEFGLVSWTAMIFCANLGGAVIYWSLNEPLWNILNPPQNAASMSLEAYDWALAYMLMHWGPTAWCTNFIAALPIAWLLFIRREPFLRPSSAMEPVIGKRIADGIIGRCIDIFFLLGLMIDVTVTMCLSTPTIAEALSSVFGTSPNFGSQALILLFSGLLAGYTVYKGLNEGIKWLSNVNVILAIILVLYCFFCGPTVQLFNIFTSALGKWLGNYPYMLFWTDPWTGGTFPRDWTIFYALFWCGFALCMGAFIARISRGRTVREIVIWGLVGTIGGTWFIHGTLGSYALYVQHAGILDAVAILKERGGAAAMIAIFGTLPFKDAVLIIYSIVSTVFLATTINSCSYICASTATRMLPPDAEPEKWHRTFWCAVMFFLALGLTYMGGIGVAKMFGNFAGALMAIPLILVIICWFKLLHVEGGYVLKYSSAPKVNPLKGETLEPWIKKIAKENGEIIE